MDGAAGPAPTWNTCTALPPAGSCHRGTLKKAVILALVLLVTCTDAHMGECVGIREHLGYATTAFCWTLQHVLLLNDGTSLPHMVPSPALPGTLRC
jgi:hypothetical protein